MNYRGNGEETQTKQYCPSLPRTVLITTLV